MKILVLDNYDSFTYNLVHIIRELGYGSQLEIYRNDKITLDEVDRFDKILLSPGPGIPLEAGIMPELIQRYFDKKSILGVCLGHQAIAEAFGGKIYNLSDVFHGIAEEIEIINKHDYLFNQIPNTLMACRYHSWAVENEFLPDELEITALDKRNIIMAMQHKKYDVRGVQFHPESIMTEHGKKMIENWLTHPIQ